jgi:multiple sugar transport system permease protein
MKTHDYYPYFLLFPTLFFLILFLGYPWIISFNASFYYYNPLYGEETKYIGLGNYIQTIEDPLFWSSLMNTIYLAVPSLLIEFLLGLGISLLISQKLRGERLIRTAVLVPMMMSPALAGLIWRLFLNPELGLLNYILNLMGMPTLLWTASPSLSIPSIIIVEVWQNTPFVILMMLAGIQAIPPDQYEVARVDGASSWQVFKHVTIPWLKPLIAIVLMFRTIFIIRTFDTIMLLFSSVGGVGFSAMVLGTYLYYNTYRLWNLGLASAISYLVLIITVALTAVYLRYMYKEIGF